MRPMLFFLRICRYAKLPIYFTVAVSIEIGYIKKLFTANVVGQGGYSIVKPQKVLKELILICLNIFFFSCGGGMDLDGQAKTLLNLLQNKNYDKCVDMTYMYQLKMSKVKEEPQFKQKEMANNISSDIKDEYFNEDKTKSIAYLFRFPCQTQILETKQVTVETSDVFSGQPNTVYRVFAVVKYNSIDQSPDAVPLLLKATDISYHNYKVKEIFFNYDLDPETGLYLGWGTHKHVPW